VRFRRISSEWMTILFCNDCILVVISDNGRSEYNGGRNDERFDDKFDDGDNTNNGKRMRHLILLLLSTFLPSTVSSCTLLTLYNIS
jgi:hypothetical protein